MTSRKRRRSKKKRKSSYRKIFDFTEPLVLFTVGSNMISHPKDVIETFYLSLPEPTRLRWEEFCVYCSEIGMWDPPILFGPIGWEKDAQREDFIGFLRYVNNQYQLFLKSALFDPSLPYEDYQLIPDVNLPGLRGTITEIVRNLREGRGVGVHFDLINSNIEFFIDTVKRTWERQFIWEVLFTGLIDVKHQTNQWVLFLSPYPLASLPSHETTELLRPVQPRWQDKFPAMGIKVIGVDVALVVVVFDPENPDPTSEETFSVTWFTLQNYLNEVKSDNPQLSAENPASLEVASDYVAQQLGRFIRLLLIQNPRQLRVILEGAISLDFGVFQEEADQWYSIATKKKLGEMILDKIEREIRKLNNPCITLGWVDSTGSYDVCSICGQPFDGSCPHFPRHRIVDLTSDCEVIDIAFEVIRKQVEKNVKQKSRVHRMAEYLVSDETGQVILTVWDNDIDFIEIGKAYLLKGGNCKLFKSALRLVRGKGIFLLLKELPWLPKNS